MGDRVKGSLEIDISSCRVPSVSYWHRPVIQLIDWTDTSLRYRHWRMCFERLLQAFARWHSGILFDIATQPILEYRWIDSYSQPYLRTQFKVATVYSIHTHSLSRCSTGVVPNVLHSVCSGSIMLFNVSNKVILVGVEWCLRKPCWRLFMRLCSCNKFIRSLAIIFSRILQQAHVRAIGR